MDLFGVNKNAKGKYFEVAQEIESSTHSYNKDYQDTLWTSTVDLLDINQNETAVSLESIK